MLAYKSTLIVWAAFNVRHSGNQIFRFIMAGFELTLNENTQTFSIWSATHLKGRFNPNQYNHFNWTLPQASHSSDIHLIGLLVHLGGEKTKRNLNWLASESFFQISQRNLLRIYKSSIAVFVVAKTQCRRRMLVLFLFVCVLLNHNDLYTSASFPPTILRWILPRE